MTNTNIVTEALVNKATGEVMEIGLQKSPDEIILDANEAAKTLEKLLLSNKMPPLEFKGHRYLEYPHWQTIAKFYHCTASTGDAVYVEIDGKKGFKAKGQVLDEKTGLVVGAAEAYCLNDEPQWKFKPFFQMASMAQTRAASKSLSNKFKYVAILAGFQPTPAEEMDGIHQGRTIQPPREMPIEAMEAPADEPAAEARETTATTISQKQQRLLYARCSANGVTTDLAKLYIKENFLKESSAELTWKELDKMLTWVDSYKK